MTIMQMELLAIPDSEWMNEWMNEWRNEWMNEGMNEI
jgi:hypothetical protein